MKRELETQAPGYLYAVVHSPYLWHANSLLTITKWLSLCNAQNGR